MRKITADLIREIKNMAFDKQLAFIQSNSTRRALFVPRRGAKSTAIAIAFLLYCLLYNDIRCIFFGLTNESAETAIVPALKPILKKIGFIEGVDFKYNHTERLYEFIATHSKISIKGIDQNYKEMAKILGSKCWAVAIDEMQDQTQDIEKAIMKNIQPVLSDYLDKGGGYLFTSGTAGDYMGDNYWYQIVTSEPGHLGFEMHTWEGKDNPFMKKNKEIEIKNFIKAYGEAFVESAWYRQQYLNQWVTDEARKVYLISNKNILGTKECLTQRPSNEFLRNAVFILGMDFGFFPDPTAFVIGCYNLKFDNKLYIVDCFSENNMLIADVSRKIQELDSIYHFTYKVGDAGAQAKAQVADLNQTYNHFIEAADKLGKYSHQNMINSDFMSGEIIIDPLKCAPLIDQLQNLIWDSAALAKSKRVEKASLHNDLCDSLLYLHHYSHHHWYKAPVTPPSEEDLIFDKILMADKRDMKKDIIQNNRKRLDPYSRR